METPLNLGGAPPAPAAHEGQARHVLARWNASIQARLLLAFFTLVLLLSAPYAFLVVPGLSFKGQYDTIIANITAANSLSGSFKPAIDAELWDVIAGKRSFAEGRQYAILDAADTQLAAMIANTGSERGRLKLDVVRRTLATLRTRVDQLGAQMAAGAPFERNEQSLERLREVSALVDENLRDYMLFEVRRTEGEYREMQRGLAVWAVAGSFGMLAAVLFSLYAAWRISRGIAVPLRKLHDVTRTITRRDLAALVTSGNADEIAELGVSFNLMVNQIRDLLAAKVREQENLKRAELRALQAQINPHFLYNTLDSIAWLAEAGRTAQVTEMVRALSRFFRISLSRGQDWITLGDELEHVQSYLAIQKLRYRDILDYRIDVPDELRACGVLKLTLQPLVENALYHGLKNRRGGGTILVRGRCGPDDSVVIEVADDGIGIPPEGLARIEAALARPAGAAPVEGQGGVGLANVDQRLKLFYGPEHGLTLRSEHGAGTIVTLTLPLRHLR